MTTHAHDPAASTLVTVRESGPGSTACTVDRLHARSATTPLVALDLIPDGNSPLLAVQLLVRSAVLAARGWSCTAAAPRPGTMPPPSPERGRA